SLIIVEAKKPTEKNLEPHIKQAKFYGDHLKSVFLVVTNGYQVKVFKRPPYRREELVFNITTDELKEKKIASEFYNQLNFSIIKQINEKAANDLTHSQYVSLEKALQRHPDIQAILDKGDFIPSITRGKKRLTVVKQKVAIKCNFPIAFDEGNCRIEFSSIILRGSIIYLTHQEILGNLITGLNTKLQWKNRSFIKKLENNNYEASLGEATVILSAAETQDLCDCVDEVFSEYKRIIIEAENTLKTWEFEPVNFEGRGLGFKLLSVGQELWELMVKFSEEFDYAKGDSDWHIFKYSIASIQVNKRVKDNILNFPAVRIHSKFSEEKIDLIYAPDPLDLELLEKYDGSWQEDVGCRGTWTATYTQKWLLEEFIPKVIDYYSGKNFNYRYTLEETIDNIENKKIPIEEIDEASQLAPYVREVQESIHLSTFEASLLYAYYKSFTDLIRRTDPHIIGMNYIEEKLGSIEHGDFIINKGKEEDYSRDNKNWNFEQAVNLLYQQVERISKSEYENYNRTDLISRTFIWVLENGNL
ncbi:MAG: hypothetical protein WBA93_23850, partial [Microcoleaceae cyanobacterium]